MGRIPKLVGFIPVLALAGAGLGLVPHGTHAFDGWCFDDPLVSIGGQQVRLDLGVQGTGAVVRKAVAGATITLAVPQGVPTQLLYLQNGAFPETVVFTHNNTAWSTGQPMTVNVTVTFSASVSLPAAVAAVYPSGKTSTYTGTTTAPIHYGFSLK